MKKKYFYVLFVTLALSGCKEDLTYSYLLQHPAVLSQKIMECQSVGAKSQTAQCEVVMRAATTLSPVIEQAQDDPEKFGQDVLDKEEACAKKKSAFQEAQQSLESLKAANASSTEIAVAEERRNKLQEEYLKQHEEVKMLLGIVGLNSPE